MRLWAPSAEDLSAPEVAGILFDWLDIITTRMYSPFDASSAIIDMKSWVAESDKYIGILYSSFKIADCFETGQIRHYGSLKTRTLMLLGIKLWKW